MKKNHLVVQSNKLIESRYSLTVGEQRLILAMVARIHPDDENFYRLYRIFIDDIEDHQAEMDLAQSEGLI